MIEGMSHLETHEYVVHDIFVPYPVGWVTGDAAVGWMELLEKRTTGLRSNI